MAGRADLKDATLLADPDFLLESMPLLPRQPHLPAARTPIRPRRIFTRSAQLRLSLDEMLQRARELQAISGKPVVLLLTTTLDHVTRPVVVREGYDWELALDPGQVERFRMTRRLIGTRERNARTDEAFDVYLLNAPGRPRHERHRARRHGQRRPPGRPGAAARLRPPSRASTTARSTCFVIPGIVLALVLRWRGDRPLLLQGRARFFSRRSASLPRTT